MCSHPVGDNGTLIYTQVGGTDQNIEGLLVAQKSAERSAERSTQPRLNPSSYAKHDLCHSSQFLKGAVKYLIDKMLTSPCWLFCVAIL